MSDLTPAETAAAEVMRTECVTEGVITTADPEGFDRVACAVVAAVRPFIAQELAESAEIIYRFAESRPITSAEAKAIYDGIAAALARPTSKEQQQ